MTGSEAKTYFNDVIIGMGTLGDDLRPTRIVGKNVGYSFLTWTVIYLCVTFGIKWTGRITYSTMGLPIILLFVFLGRSLTLPGAQNGIDEYIRDANWDVLTETPEVWSKAVSQIFFSLRYNIKTCMEKMLNFSYKRLKLNQTSLRDTPLIQLQCHLRYHDGLWVSL